MKKTMLLFAIAAVLASCNNEKKDEADKKETAISSMESKQERNKKIIMASMDAAAKGDVDGMVKDAAANFIDYTDGSMPPVTNTDSLKGFIKMLFHSIEGYKPENTMLFADGDYVLAYADWTGTFKNDLMGIKATGKPVKLKDVDIFKFNEEGKIIEHRSIQNTGAVLMSSGMMK
jgi:predicted ester cyclase